MGYRAAWDTVPRGIPCRMGYRAACRFWTFYALFGPDTLYILLYDEPYLDLSIS